MGCPTRVDSPPVRTVAQDSGELQFSAFLSAWNVLPAQYVVVVMVVELEVMMGMEEMEVVQVEKGTLPSLQTKKCLHTGP